MRNDFILQDNFKIKIIKKLTLQSHHILKGFSFSHVFVLKIYISFQTFLDAHHTNNILKVLQRNYL